MRILAIWSAILAAALVGGAIWAAGGNGMKLKGFIPLIVTMLVALEAGLWLAGSPAVRAQPGGAFEGGNKFVTITTASTNCGTLAIPGPHQILEISLQNTNAANNFLHLYDIATTPVAGALPGQIGVYALPGIGATPGVAAGGFAPTISGAASSVANGIGFCITLNAALSDATNATVGGIVNWTVK